MQYLVWVKLGNTNLEVANKLVDLYLNKQFLKAFQVSFDSPGLQSLHLITPNLCGWCSYKAEIFQKRKINMRGLFKHDWHKGQEDQNTTVLYGIQYSELSSYEDSHTEKLLKPFNNK